MKALWMFLACLSLGGCQLLLDVDSKQCARDADCVGLLGRGYVCASSGICKRDSTKPDANDAGGASASGIPKRWACIEDPPFEVPPGDPGAKVTATFDVLDFTTLNPPKDLKVNACGQTDVGCTAPLVEGATADADGYFTFELPYGFDGYFELIAPDFTPSLSYSNRPATEDVSFPGPLLVSPQAVKDLAGFGGESVDTNLATVVIEVLDCDGNPGDGVRLTKKEEQDEHPFYFEGALPDRQLDATTITTALGRNHAPRSVGGFSNVEPGYVTFEATLVKPAHKVTTAAAQMRAGYITFVRLQAGY